MAARIMKTDTGERAEAALNAAREVILSGGLVALPTESFYGLAADVMDPIAVRRLMAAKRRPEDNPILILIPSRDVLKEYAAAVTPVALELIKRFWPGGLTMVFEARRALSRLLTAGTGKIGVRLSSHPLPTELARLVGRGITGTSANRSGQRACTRADEVMEAVGNEIDLILDGGETRGGPGSTVLDVTVDPPIILRDGMVPRETLEAVLRALSSPNALPSA